MWNFVLDCCKVNCIMLVLYVTSLYLNSGLGVTLIVFLMSQWNSDIRTFSALFTWHFRMIPKKLIFHVSNHIEMVSKCWFPETSRCYPKYYSVPLNLGKIHVCFATKLAYLVKGDSIKLSKILLSSSIESRIWAKSMAVFVPNWVIWRKDQATWEATLLYSKADNVL